MGQEESLAVVDSGVELYLTTDKEFYYPGDYVSGEIYLVFNR